MAKNQTVARAEFDKAIGVWEKAQIIYEAPQKREPEAWTTLVDISARPDEFQDLLIASLVHPNQLVVGYCLLALERMRSKALGHLPAELLCRREKITLQMGSFRTSSDLGGLARRIEKRSKGDIV